MKSADVNRIVYASPIYALKVSENGIVDETLPFDPLYARSAYDHSEATASLEIQAAADAGMDAVIVCPTSVIEPYDFHSSDAGRGILYNMKSGINFILDGAYDFVNVREVTQGMVLEIERGCRGETYILGGERWTGKEVSDYIWETTGGWHAGIWLPDWVSDLTSILLPLMVERPLITPYSLSAVRSNSQISHEKAMHELGYQPRPAGQALRDAINWWQHRVEGGGHLPETNAQAFI